MNDISALLIANLCLLLSVLLWTWKMWLPMFRPDLFYIFRIFGTDMLRYKEYKLFLPLAGNKDKYTIDKSDYDKSGVKPYINPQGVDTWDFIKGQLEPITHKNNSEYIDGRLVHNLAKDGSEVIDDIVSGNNDLSDFLKTWGVFIVGSILVLMLGYMITQSQESSNLTLQLLSNISRRG